MCVSYPTFIAAPLGFQPSAQLKISQVSCYDIEIWYEGSLNTISEIVVIGFISTCPMGLTGLSLLFKQIS